MKKLLSFDEFLNESLITEGTMATRSFKDKDLYDMGRLEDNWDSDWEPLMKILVKKLGVKDASQIIQVDENSEDGNKFAGKIYDYLLKAFNPSEEINNNVCDCSYDKFLNVTRTEDMGFIAFQYTDKSNF